MKGYIVLALLICFGTNVLVFAQEKQISSVELTTDMDLIRTQMQQDMDFILPHVIDFDEVYDVKATDKTYNGSSIQRQSADLTRSLIWSPHREWDDQAYMSKIVTDHLLNQRIHTIISNYTRYVSDRYIDNYGPCAKQNFMRAFDEFGTTILQPGDSININKLLAGLDGYCKGEGGEYMFYQGVCGFSTQVRRNALINPYLTTTRRSAHGNRRQAYYGEEIVGDDAAIYEMDKQLEIMNKSDLPIYMQTIERAGKKYLLSAVPTQTSNKVHISRENVGPMMGRVTRTIKDKASDKIIDQDVYNSYYRGVIKGSN